MFKGQEKHRKLHQFFLYLHGFGLAQQDAPSLEVLKARLDGVLSNLG